MSGILETNNIFKILSILAVLTILILYLVGLGYSTHLYFKDKKISDYTKTQQNLMKMSNILTIIFAVLCVLVVSYASYNSRVSMSKKIDRDSSNLYIDTQEDKLFDSPSRSSRYLSLTR